MCFWVVLFKPLLNRSTFEYNSTKMKKSMDLQHTHKRPPMQVCPNDPLTPKWATNELPTHSRNSTNPHGTKGQLISKRLFGVFKFFQKTNENKST